MRARIEMELEDVPGQLIEALEPISRFGANIQNVVHQRERKTPLGRVPVTVIFDVDDREKLDRIVELLEESGVRIARLGEREAAAREVLLMVGRVIGADIRKIVDRLGSLEGVRVSDLSLAMGRAGEESATRVTVEATDDDRMREALSHLEEIGMEKGLLIIKSLGVFP